MNTISGQNRVKVLSSQAVDLLIACALGKIITE